MTDKPKRKRRRVSDSKSAPSDGETIPPFEDVVPGIPDTVDNIVSAFWQPPKKDGEWRYQKKYGRKRN